MCIFESLGVPGNVVRVNPPDPGAMTTLIPVNGNVDANMVCEVLERHSNYECGRIRGQE